MDQIVPETGSIPRRLGIDLFRPERTFFLSFATLLRLVLAFKYAQFQVR
jgi:hypothetical protein